MGSFIWISAAQETSSLLTNLVVTSSTVIYPHLVCCCFIYTSWEKCCRSELSECEGNQCDGSSLCILISARKPKKTEFVFLASTNCGRWRLFKAVCGLQPLLDHLARKSSHVSGKLPHMTPLCWLAATVRIRPVSYTHLTLPTILLV